MRSLRVICLVGLAAFVTLAAVAPPAPPTFDPHPPRPATVLAVHDGDTITARISFDMGVSFETPVRLAGFNASELAGPHPQQAAAARDRLAALLASGVVWVRPTGAKSMTRWVGRAYVVPPTGAPVDVAATMIAEGHDVPQGQ